MDLSAWLKTPAGRYLLAWEQAQLDRAVADIFGFNALQLGLPELDGLQANRMPQRWLACDGAPQQPARAALLTSKPSPSPAHKRWNFIPTLTPHCAKWNGC